ncbi:MAG: tRNA (adenosine(37)-N6)-dimethylallyltransferase MiaA [Bacteroidota bacterium]
MQGPTASGKTALGIALAKHFKTVILSADSRQFYKEMSIGTAKPSLEEQDEIKHYFIDSHSIENPVSAADFEREALEVLENEFQRHENIILVGGSGMFIDALCNGLDDIPNDVKLRDELTLFVQKNGLESLLEELKSNDLEYYNFVDKSNPVRIIRAIEAIRISGKTYTELRQKKSKTRPFEIMRFVIDLPREKLYERINLRADLMIQNGLIDEVKQLTEFRHLQSLNTVGYSEIFDFLDDKISLEEAINLVKQNSRRYAKRQLTWFRRNEKAIWLKNETTADLKKEVLGLLNSAQ